MTGAWPEGLLGAPSACAVEGRIFTSGIMARDATGLESEAHQVFRSAVELLLGQGAVLGDAVRTRIFYTQEGAADLLGAVHGVVFDSPGPAMSSVLVDCLPRDSKVALEVEAIRGASGSMTHYGEDAAISSSRAVRYGDVLFVAGLSAPGAGSHAAQMDAVYDAGAAALAEAGMTGSDVVSTRHYYAHEIESETDGIGKNEFMAAGEPTSAGICVVGPTGQGATFSLEFEAVVGAAGTRRNYRTGRTFEVENHYSRAVRAGAVIYVAGTTSIIPGEIVQHPGEVGLQITDTLAIIRTAIEELGGEWAQLARTRTYVVGGLEKLDEAAAALRAATGGTNATGTLMGVPVLGRPEVVVEIEATAAVGE
jgi:enamine deaminase RidA (YjgF/YER057c/UK114 family)